VNRMWRTWRSFWAGQEAAGTLSVIRILLSLVVLADLFEVWRLHLIIPLWGPGDAGGMGNPAQQATPPELYAWFGNTVAVGRAAFFGLVGALLCLAAGLLAQLAALVAVLLYAQLALVLPGADRGIDMLIRNVLLLMVFVPTGRRFGLDALLFGPLARVPSWPRRLLVLQLAVLYFTAGIQKAAVAWWPWGGFSALYLVLQDPAVARYPFAWLQRFYPATQALTAATMSFEWLAGLVPLVFWFRSTRTHPGWLRAQLNRSRFLQGWMLLGAGMHLGIAATMQLGIFPWTVLALYPALFHPDEAKAIVLGGSFGVAPRTRIFAP
jgi:hypothetical protein